MKPHGMEDGDKKDQFEIQSDSFKNQPSGYELKNRKEL
jgi:hypothetical protein